LENISTYIQSGNVIFDTEINDRAKLSELISEQIKDTFGYDVPVIIRRPDEISRAIARFPFQEKKGWKGYISFLSEEPDSESLNQWISSSSDIEKLAVEGNHLFSLVNKQTNEKPQFSNSLVEKIVYGPATTRNLRTVRKILEMG
ncbi:MAG: DUF1697 domain-containing protein, partial [Candidatus Halalkalibacterium sp. M3_1C_030]